MCSGNAGFGSYSEEGKSLIIPLYPTPQSSGLMGWKQNCETVTSAPLIPPLSSLLVANIFSSVTWRHRFSLDYQIYVKLKVLSIRSRGRKLLENTLPVS